MSVSTELLLLRVVGEVVVRVDGLVEKSDAVKIVVCCWGCEITRPIPQEDTALVVARKFFVGEANCGIWAAMSICIQVVKFAYTSSGRSSFDQALLTGLQSTDLHGIRLDRLT